MAWGKRIRVEDLARPNEFVSDVPIQMRFNDAGAAAHVVGGGSCGCQPEH